MRTVSQFLLTFLLNASWQILLIGAIASLSDLILRRISARYRHAVWVVALLLMVLLPALSAAIGGAPTRPVSVTADAKSESVPVVVTRISSLEGEEIEPAEAKPTSAVATTKAPEGERLWPVRVNPRLAATLLAIYALLVLYALIRLVLAWRRTRHVVRTAFHVDLPQSAQTIIQTCERAINTRPVRVLCSSSIPVPITLGVRKPIIILPLSLLNNIDDELLISAVGHELVHIDRRDYLANLVYEFLYLPVWFHPAAWLIRRRIRQTRELCCDELVTLKLLRPEIYARSLVRMIGTSPLNTHPAADTTIGIVESDNLEGRIMSLLKSRTLSNRRKHVLLIAAALLLAVPCLAATSFALSLEINQQEPTQTRQQGELQEQERLRAQAQLLETQKLREQRVQSSAQSQTEARLREVKLALEAQRTRLQRDQQQNPEARAEIEARLREVQRNLEEHKKLVQQYYQERGSEIERAREVEKRLSQLATQYQESAQMRDAQKLLENQKLMEQQYRNAAQGTRKPKVIHRVEPVYPADAREQKIKGSVLLTMVVDRDGNPQDLKVSKSLYPSLDQAAIEAARQMRFEPALRDGQPVSETLLIEFYFSLESKHTEVMGYGGKITGNMRGQVTGEGAGYATSQGTGEGAGYQNDVRETRRRKDQEGGALDDRARRQADLAQGAVITMDRAIQIATSKYPGKVLACSLGRDKDGPVFYHLVIIVTEGDKTVTKYVWLSAIDGTILKTEDQRKAAISGGVLNGKTVSLPLPAYPEIARAARASGTVTVEIMVDEDGSVISARAVSGHPLLQAAAVDAARQAKLTPTRLEGQPIKVRGLLVYNFVAQ